MKRNHKKFFSCMVALLMVLSTLTPVSAISEIPNESGTDEGIAQTSSIDVLPTYPMTLTVVNKDDSRIAGLEFSVTDSQGTPLQFVNANGNYEIAENGYYRTVTSDDNGIIHLAGLSGGSYIFSYTNNNPSYVLSEPKEIIVSATNSTGFIEMKLNAGSLVLTLTAENGTVISGSDFTIKNSAGQDVLFATNNDIYYPDEGGSRTVRTNSQGRITIEDLPIGDYTLTQTSKPDEYNGELITQAFNITYNTQTTISVTNSKNYGSIRISVLNTANEAITGSEYNLYDSNNNMLYFTGNAGSYTYSKTEGSNVLRPSASGITISELPVGNYTLKEITAPQGYDSADSITFSITKDQEATATIKNVKSVGTLEIKVTDETTQSGVAGYTFSLSSENNATLKFNLNSEGDYTYSTNGSTSALVSNADGNIIVNGLPSGSYILTQTIASKGYIIDRAQVRQNISSQKTTTYSAVVSKSNASINVIDEEGNPVVGVNVQVKDEAGNIAFEGLTNENGRLLITGVQAGKYIYLISETPSTFLNKQYTQEFTMDEKGNVTGLDTCVLEATRVSVTIEEKLAGAVFELKASNGDKYTATTDEEGVATFNKLPDDTYTLKQIEAPEGYEVSEATHEITIDRDYKENVIVNFSNNTISTESESSETTEDSSDSTTNSETTENPTPDKKNTGTVIFVIALIVLLVIGATVYAIVKTKKDESKENKPNENKDNKPSTPPSPIVTTPVEPEKPVDPEEIKPDIELTKPDVEDFNADPYEQEAVIETQEKLANEITKILDEKKEENFEIKLDSSESTSETANSTNVESTTKEETSAKVELNTEKPEQDSEEKDRKTELKSEEETGNSKSSDSETPADKDTQNNKENKE